MMKNLTIKKGGMYQEWMSLIDLVEEDTAERLNEIAAKDGWCELSTNEAKEMGFEELVNWSKSDTDVLVMVGDEYLVCVNKNDLQ